MKKLLLTLAIFLFLYAGADAQLWKLRRYEISAAVGTTQLYGDIGGYTKGENALGFKDISISQTRFNFMAGFRYRVAEKISLKLNLAFGSFYSSDVTGSNEGRGFKSTTTFFEPTISGEYYFIKNKNENSYLVMNKGKGGFKNILSKLDLYAFTGIGGLSFKVHPNDPLAAMNQKTSGFTPVIPLGVGVNLNYSSYVNFGVELSSRFTFSDYVDGYTSAYSKSNDLYHFINFTFTYKLKTGMNGWPTF
jgi:hypothetical protein